MTGPVELEVTERDGGPRLDAFVSRAVPDLSRARARSLIEGGLVLVDGIPILKASRRLDTGRVVTVMPSPPERSDLIPWHVPLQISYEDSDLLVVNKAAGMPVHPGPGHPDDTLANAVVARLPEVAGVGDRSRPGIVHRLDADTSGLIIVAKTAVAHTALAAQFADRRVKKKYLALVTGSPDTDEAVIEAPIGRSPYHRKKMAVVSTGRPATTPFSVIHRFLDCTLVEVRPTTGRTHQIRVHFASAGLPVVGDRIYGRPNAVLGRQFLHASGLAFDHPADGRRMELVCPLPDDLRTYLSEVLNFWAEMTDPSPQ